MRHLLIVPLALALATGCLDSVSDPVDPDPGPDPTDPDPGDPGPDPDPPAVDLLAEFSACMSLDHWNQTNMGNLWANKTTSFAAVCRDCHNDGLAFFYANLDPLKTFEYTRYEVFMRGFFTIGVDPDTREAQVIPAFAKLTNKAKGANVHPLYTYGNGYGIGDQAFAALRDFHELTMQRVERNRAQGGGFCDPIGFPTPPEPEPDPLP